MDRVCNKISTLSYTFGLWTLRYDGLLFYDGKVLHVPPKELRVLRVLLGDAGVLVSKDQLLDSVWPGGEVSEESLTRCICALRKLLGVNRDYIKTIYGKGYCFTGSVVLSALPPHVSDSKRAPSLLVLPFDVDGCNGGGRLHRELVRQLAKAFGRTLVVMPVVLTSSGLSGGSSLDLITRLKPDFYLGLNCVLRSGCLELSIELVRGQDHSLVHAESMVTTGDCCDVAQLLAETIARQLPGAVTVRSPYVCSPFANGYLSGFSGRQADDVVRLETAL
ncbi:winged helix-turn-helix domain-containing protein [Pseudomonas fluorescens]|uniref:Transcriptional regulator HilA n=1 Tax=Pseudomonas fluorescens TaxID=294 RepID=A0A5E7GCN3_PSEFL|nr:winged helix-turn-helix domain-containing protein [Pseudomonas fluorescens]VVO48632.1 Transcriptional regulator HilA [Pseudomonas fluorescens]